MTDNNYPRPLLCECNNVIGYVVRGSDRARRLNVLRLPRKLNGEIPEFNLYNYSVFNLDQGDVHCLHCEKIFEWKSSDFIKRKEERAKTEQIS